MEVKIKYYSISIVVSKQTTCRDWMFRVFFSGDYELLCTMYGLSGASGKLKHSYLYYNVMHSSKFQEGTTVCGTLFETLT